MRTANLLTTRFGLTPSETLFIDAAPVNVEGARVAGFEAHRFVDAPTLERTLVDLGLLGWPAVPLASTS